jgi:hypothetical protein
MVHGLDRSVQTRISSGINVLLGALLFASSWIFEHTFTGPGLTSAVVGGLIVLCGALRFLYPRGSAWLSGLNIALGTSAVLLPWFEHYTANTQRLWFTVILGLGVVALATWSGGATLKERQQRLGHA